MTGSEHLGIVERPVAAKPAGQVRPRRRRRQSSAIKEGLMGIALLAGPANVVMQLSRPAVGYGVAESRVESGRIDRHPVKRARTTFTYLAVATKGTADQKEAFGRAVNQVHAQVYSTSASPLSYRAFDPGLQLWVAACLYKGAVDVRRIFIGEMDEPTADEHYREGMALGTTLQVPPEMWPPDRSAFDAYWRESLEDVHIDDTIRDFLYPIASGRVLLPLPQWMPNPIERLSLFLTTGFLPQRFRDEMGLPWDGRRQRRFDQLTAALRLVNRLSPTFVREFPFNILLRELDWRIRTRRPLV